MGARSQYCTDRGSVYNLDSKRASENPYAPKRDLREIG